MTFPTPISPYSGEQNRAIKALSAADITSLKSGAGMAYAKAAELNNFPGPAHVLELATPLKLDASQRQASEALMAAHKSEARLLGNQLVEAERQLDLAFSTRQITPQLLDTLTNRIGELQAALRAEHLQTHLKQTALLNSQQIASYQVLRGYSSANATQPILKTP